MGDREDIDPTGKGGTEPGVGPRTPAGNMTKPGIPPPPPRRSGKGPVAAPAHVDIPVSEEPAPVDFDALHAALGPAAKAPVAESQGRSSATYASARPRSVPPAYVAAELDAPPVIVAQDDTVPGAPPQMTAPLTSPMAPPVGGPPISGPHGIVPPVSSSPMPAAMPLPQPPTPNGFRPAGTPQLTMRMPERPRRPRTPTVVVRDRGPSLKQKIAVFALMLVLVSACGIGILMWRAPYLFGIGAPPSMRTAAPPPRILTATAPAPTPVPAAAVTATATAAGTATATATTATATPKAKKPAR